MLFTYSLSRKAWKKWPYYTAIAKRDLQNAAAIHFLTEYERDKIHPYLNLTNNSFIVPNGVESEEFDYLLPEDRLRDRYPKMKDKKIILFLGRLNWKKGLDILVDAFSKLIENKKDLHLLIAGPDEGGYIRKVEKWIEDKGIDEHVTLTGMLNGKYKTEAFVESDMFILPSYSEGLSISILEAMYYGLPVIVSDQSHFPEILKYNAGKVVPCEATAVSQAMEQLIDDDELRSNLGENGKKLVKEKFALDKISGEMINNYTKIIEEHRIKSVDNRY